MPLAALCLAALPARAQTVKTITVSGDASYTDHISLAEDSRDMDLLVKFIFDEPGNVLTVSVMSYRSLFVFREAVRYPSVIRCGRLHPELLPYVAESAPGSRFRLSRSLKKSIPRPRREYVFRRWAECEGMQAIPAEYKMVNDYIEQSFDILQKREAVTVTLRDIYVLGHTTDEPDLYELLRGRDLNLKYQIRILRNPCLGLEEELAAATKLCGDVEAAYRAFKASYASGDVPSEEALKTFEETRALLLLQFPARQNLLQCPAIIEAVDKYNAYVDSLTAMKCVVRPQDVAAPWDDSKGLDTKMVYSMARQLDRSVARWLVSKDELEKSDLVEQCLDIIEDMSAMIKRHRVSTPAEQKAVKVYREAEQYFRKTCKR